MRAQYPRPGIFSRVKKQRCFLTNMDFTVVVFTVAIFCRCAFFYLRDVLHNQSRVSRRVLIVQVFESATLIRRASRFNVDHLRRVITLLPRGLRRLLTCLCGVCATLNDEVLGVLFFSSEITLQNIADTFSVALLSVKGRA